MRRKGTEALAISVGRAPQGALCECGNPAFLAIDVLVPEGASLYGDAAPEPGSEPLEFRDGFAVIQFPKCEICLGEDIRLHD